MTVLALRKYIEPVAAANRRLVVGVTILSAIAIVEELLAYSRSLA